MKRDAIVPRAENVVILKRAYESDGEQLVVELEQHIQKIDEDSDFLLVSESRLRTWLRLAQSVTGH